MTHDDDKDDNDDDDDLTLLKTKHEDGQGIHAFSTELFPFLLCSDYRSIEVP